MKQRTLFLKAATFVLLCISFQQTNAEVTGISNSLLTVSFSNSARIPIFKSRPNVVRVSGPWLDTTNDIDAEGLSGQANFNIGITKKNGPANPYVEFTLNSDRTGRYRIRLKRPGGEDAITIEYTDHLSIAETKFLTIGNSTPAYLEAFPINTDIRLRITGTNVDRISFKPSGINFAISNATIGTATASLKDVGFRYSRRDDKVSIGQSDFVFSAAGREFKYSEYKGNGVWNANNLPFFRAYDKPDFMVVDRVTGIYNRKQGSCGAVSLNNNFMIENPSRCVTEFSLANPTPEAPLVVKTVTIPDVKFTIKNNSYAPQFTPITVHVKFGLNILQVITIPRLIAQQEMVIAFRRAETQKKLVRHLSCAECFELNEATFNWIDPAYTVVVDPETVIPELSDINNSRTFTGSTTVQ